MRKITTVVACLAAALTLTGCANLETLPDQQGLRYSGGALLPEAVEFKNCQGPRKQEFGGPGDNTYLYPAGQRTFKFSADPGSDSGPLSTSAPSPGGGQPITMGVSGTITFTPRFDDCESLRSFHERIGLKFRAWEPDGWNRMIGTYVKDSADRAIDSESLKSTWMDLTANSEAKTAWERRVVESLPALVNAQAGGDFFKIDNVILQRPELPDNIRSAIADTEAARQQAATADQFKAAAERFPGGPTAYQAFQQQQALNKAIAEGKVQVVPVPYGSPVIVGGGR